MPEPVVKSFLKTVRTHPTSTAVISANDTWSYDEIGGLAGSVSRYLRSAGLQKGARVATLVPNSGEYISIYYGIHLAGAVVVPLNYQEPAKVIANLLGHCGANVVFVHRDYKFLDELLDLVGLAGRQIIVLESRDRQKGHVGNGPWREIQEHGNSGHGLEDCAEDVDGSDFAMIIYTSGTTGEPKGVTLSHANLSANTQSILECLPVRRGDRCFSVLPFYYSFGNSILQTHVTAGACVVLQNSIAFPHAVLKEMERYAVTSFYGVPTTYALLFEGDRLRSVDFSSLRYIAQAGGPMPVSQQRQLLADLPWIEIYIMYGQTEAAARLTCLDPRYLLKKIGSVGKGIPGVQIRVGDDPRIDYSAKSPGEIYARGENIMVGYWSDGEATAKVLSAGWLKTGDLGYFDADGFLYIAGRSTDMIKTGANRVSPAEIEEVIQRIPGVLEVGACGIPDEILGQAIAVAIVPRENANLEIRDIQRSCLQSLTSYKVPKVIRFVAALPKTSTGKLQRHVLTREFRENKTNDKSDRKTLS